MSESVDHLPLVSSLLSNDRLYVCRYPNLDRAITGDAFSTTLVGAHTHDDRYFTETEVTALLLAAATIAAAAAVPIGTVDDYVGATAPDTNWLLMTGQTVVNAQTLYTVLWGRIPAGWKSGSSMVLPDTRGKVAVSLDTGDASFDVIGEIGGFKTHALTPAETAIKGHGHTVSDPGHFHNVPRRSAVVTAELYDLVAGTNTAITSVPTDSKTTGLTVTNLSDGANGAAHNNLQPYIVFQRMIKVL